MADKNPDVDAYIDKASDFAKPILKKLRKAFHKGCPKLEENIKWGVPSFEYKGMMVGMAAFKAHVSWGFWKAKLMDDPDGILPAQRKASPMSIKAASVKDLPAEAVIAKYVKQAAALNEKGVKPKPAATKKAPRAPKYMLDAIKKNEHADEHWKAFTPGKRKDYIKWITSAKREATRDKRLQQAVAWIAEGKSRNWKYEKR